MSTTSNTNDCGDSSIKSETLDEIFKGQVAELRDLVLKKAEVHDIELCRKWLKVFNRATKSEKLARNCLCTLMQHQLKESECLAEPFTNLNNCKRNLECLLQELDTETQNSLSSYKNESLPTYKSHGAQEACCCGHTSEEALKDCQENENHLEMFRLLNEKEFEIEKLKEIMEKQRVEMEEIKKIVDQQKINILTGIRKKLLELSHDGATKHMQLFEAIFQIHSEDSEFMDTLRNFDSDLRHIISKHLELSFNKYRGAITRQIYRKFLKKKSSLRLKYERRLTMQCLTQKLQIKLAKLKCISELRQIIVRSNGEDGRMEVLEILNILAAKYDDIVNES